MNWPKMRTAMQAAVTAMTGIVPANVFWKGDFQETAVVVGTRAVLSTNSVKGYGWDEEIRTDAVAVPLDDQDVLRCGQRGFTWSIQVESQNQGPITTARVLMDYIRVRIYRPSVKGILNAAGMAIQDVLPTVHRDYVASGRMISWGNCDVLMLAAENDRDDSEMAGSWIGEALIQSDSINGPDGNPLPTQVDLDVNAKG